jgi:hypothetical protein
MIIVTHRNVAMTARAVMVRRNPMRAATGDRLYAMTVR